MATWVCGGTCIIDPRIEIGHLFKKSVNHPRPSSEFVYNKLRIALLTLPLEMAFTLIREIVTESQNDSGRKRAGKWIRNDMSEIIKERTKLLEGVRSDENFWSFVSRFPHDAVGLTAYEMHSEGNVNDKLSGNSTTCSRCGHVTEVDWSGNEFPAGWTCTECGFDRATLRLAGKIEGWANVTPGVAGANKAAVACKGDKEGNDGK